MCSEGLSLTRQLARCRLECGNGRRSVVKVLNKEKKKEGKRQTRKGNKCVPIFISIANNE